MQFDIWIPEHNVCFEFQDSYHYVTAWYNQVPQQIINQKDSTKDILARQQELTLVIVPCWWDGSEESLEASISFHRPDLISNSVSEPIALNPSQHFFPLQVIPGVGELMLASFPLDDTFKERVPSNAWWLGEKYDGIRCCWSPVDRKLFSRNGNVLHLTPQHHSLLPKCFVDGEFWFGRGQFSDIYTLLNISDDVDWSMLRMVSFDVPSYSFQNKPFEKRYRHLLANVTYNHPINEKIVVARVLCKSKAHLAVMVQSVIENDGEGIILRKRGSLYLSGRNPFLVKLKTSPGDKEAVVVKKNQDHSVELKMPNGKIILVPSKDILVPTIEVGEIVSFFYEANARRDLPVNPKIYRIRSDISWMDVIRNSISEKRYLNELSNVVGLDKTPIDQWTMLNMRLFMEVYAKSKSLDPFDPHTWYRIPRDEIQKTQNGRILLQTFRGYFPALEALFPNIGLDKSAFNSSMWSNIETRRRFFERYAKDNRFDPQNPNSWYAQQRGHILATKGATGVMSHHKNSVTQALVDLFPNIGLSKSNFVHDSKWKYARDPLNPENSSSPSAKRLLKIAQSAQAKAVAPQKDPVIVTTPKQENEYSRPVSPGYWADATNRRQYMEWLAIQLGYRTFQDWYQVDLRAFLAHHGAGLLAHAHRNSPSAAVVDAFPEHKWERFKFRVVPHGHWDDAKNQRNFMEWLGQKLGYGPIEDWYKIDKTSFLENYGAGFLKKFGNSPRNAVVEVFKEHKWERERFIGRIDLVYRPTNVKKSQSHVS